MSLSELGGLAVLGAGFAAGTVNAIVGSGSLITFPTLLAVGYPALTANVSNTVGLVPGSLSAIVGYRAEIRQNVPAVQALSAWSLGGGITGAILLLLLPSAVFDKAVGVLVAHAVALMALQPRLSAALEARGRARTDAGAVLKITVFATGVYGGYFGAAQGVILIGLLGLLLPVSLQHANAVKNVLVGIVNAVAGVAFIISGHVAWWPVLLIAVGSSLGGQVGSRYGRRLPSSVLRTAVVLVGGVVAIVLLIQHHG